VDDQYNGISAQIVAVEHLPSLGRAQQGQDLRGPPARGNQRLRRGGKLRVR